MTRLASLWRGLRNRGRMRALDAELDAEIATHLAQRADDLVRAGLRPDEARRRARQEFGAVDRYREEARDARQPWRLEALARDVRYAARSLARHPVFLITAAVSIALGTGVNAVLLTAVRALLFQRPTVTFVDRLHRVEPGNSDQFSWPNYEDLRDSRIFEATAGYRAGSFSMRGDGMADRVTGLIVTPDFFDTLGDATAMGRTFTANEAHPSRQPRLVVVSHDAWQRRFGADPHVLGRTLHVNGEPFTVIGVLPERYVSPAPLLSPELYLPVSTATVPDIRRRANGNALTVLGRLRPRVTPAQAMSQVAALGAELERRFPDDNAGAGRGSSVTPMSEPPDFLVELRTLGTVLLVLFSVVLLIACANVAGLTLARAATRERELTVRAALGASRARMLQLLLIESVIVATAGTVLGLLLGVLTLPLLQSLTVAGIGTMHVTLRPEPMLAVYGLVVIVLSTLTIGLVPAWRQSRAVREAAVLRDGTAGASARLRLRYAFVVGQVAGAVVLLALAMMLMRSVQALQQMDAGFDLDRVAVVSIHQTPAAFGRDGGLAQAHAVLDALASGGFPDASVAAIVPLSGEASATGVRREDEAGDSQGTRALLNSVGTGYFRVLGVPVRQGRVFDDRDGAGSPRVVVINQRLADLLYPDGGAVGRGVKVSEDEVLGIVGVVATSKLRSLGEAPQPMMYYAHEQLPRLSSQVRDLHVHVRTPDDPQHHLRVLEALVRNRLGGDVVVTAHTLRAAAATEADLRRFVSTLLAGVGLLGLVVAATGLYGVMAFVVATSTRELGIRLALGAPTNRILAGTIARGVLVVLAGMTLGFPLAMIGANALGAAISGFGAANPLKVSDPGMLLATTLLLAGVGVVASYLPARRASRLDPGTVLRQTA